MSMTKKDYEKMAFGLRAAWEVTQKKMNERTEMAVGAETESQIRRAFHAGVMLATQSVILWFDENDNNFNREKFMDSMGITENDLSKDRLK